MKLLPSLIVFILIFLINAHAQKPPLDTTAFKKWPDLGSPTISNDGKYVFYKIHNNEYGIDTIVLQSTNARFKKNILNAKPFTPKFSEDSRSFIYVTNGDSLCIYSVNSDKVFYIPQVKEIITPRNGIKNWVLCRKSDATSTLVCINLQTYERRSYGNAAQCIISDDESILVISVKKLDDDSETLSVVNMNTGKQKTILSGNSFRNLLLDNSSQKLTFLQSTSSDSTYLLCYSINENNFNNFNCIRWVNSDSGLVISEIESFSQKGDRIFVYLTSSQENEYDVKTKESYLKIWSYTDLKLQSLQLKELGNVKRYLAVINIKEPSIVRIEYDNESARIVNNETVLIENRLGDVHPSEYRWNRYAKKSLYLMSLDSGNRTPLVGISDYNISISPFGDFLVFYDIKRRAYYSVEVSSGTKRELSSNESIDWQGERASGSLRGIAGWSKEDSTILIYDEFDIWKVDPRAIKRSFNYTNGYGQKNKIAFTLALSSQSKKIITKDGMLLTAFNTINKDNGFYYASKREAVDPTKLIMSPCIYDIEKFVRGTIVLPSSLSMAPVKSSNKDIYIVMRSSVNSFPNYYSTSDFRRFTRLSNICPEKEYNWYTTELHKWKSFWGDTISGILYKPENFDSTLSYPLIFYYYDRRTDGLNTYWKPDFLTSACVINIPYYVSNGYLVVATDIEYRTGEIGESVINSVGSAANYFSQIKYVDSLKLGINGFSHGGYETYFLVANSGKFAAASAGGGVTDLVSSFGSLRDKAYSKQDMGQMRMGDVTLWKRPDLFIKNSPVFNAPNVNTPLLMMHTSYDMAVDFSQAIELFTALRRLGKRVWLLEYTQGNHGVWGQSAKDYSFRMLQFFDHYLKNKPAPLWMTQGIQASRSGIDSGFEYDLQIKTPGRGLDTEN